MIIICDSVDELLYMVSSAIFIYRYWISRTIIYDFADRNTILAKKQTKVKFVFRMIHTVFCKVLYNIFIISN